MTCAIASLLMLGLLSSAAATSIESDNYEYNGEGCGCVQKLEPYQNQASLPINYAVSSPSECNCRQQEPTNYQELSVPDLPAYRLDFVADEPLQPKPNYKDLHTKVERISFHRNTQDYNKRDYHPRGSCGCHKPFYRFVYKKPKPNSSQRHQYKSKPRKLTALVVPKKSLRSSGNGRYYRHKREVHQSKFLEDRKRKNSKRSTEFYNMKLPERRLRVMEVPSNFRPQKPFHQQEPQKEKMALNEAQQKLETAAKYRTPLSQQKPRNIDPNLKYRQPLKRESPIKRQASLHLPASLKSKLPCKRQAAINRQRMLNTRLPLQLRQLLNRQARVNNPSLPNLRTLKTLGKMLRGRLGRLKSRQPLLASRRNHQKLVKRDIKAEYDLLQREREQMDLTLPEIIQFMPETLQRSFKRGQCNIGCSSLTNSPQLQAENSSDSMESLEAEERDDIVVSSTKNSKNYFDDGVVFYLMPPSENTISNTHIDDSSQPISTAFEADAASLHASAASTPIYAFQTPSFNYLPLFRASYSTQFPVLALSSSPAELPSALQIRNVDLDKFIVDTLQRHPDFIKGKNQYEGGLVAPEPLQIAETKDLLRKLVVGRLKMWLGY